METQLKAFYRQLDVILRRKWLFIMPAVLISVVGIFLAETLQAYYRSSTIIMVERQQVPESYVTPADKTPFNQRLNTMRQQVMSRPKLEKIINDFHLYQNAPAGNPFVAVLKKIGINMNIKPLTKEEMLDKMASDIDARVIGGSSGDAFSISYIGTDPNVTMQVTNTLASLFIEENLKAREEYAEGTAEFLSHELDNARKGLESQEKAVKAFKEKYMGGLPQELDANLRTLDRLQSELLSITAAEKNSKDRKAMLEAQLNQSFDAPASAPDSSALELRKQQHELARLLSIYNENYPDVIIAKKRVSELQALMKRSSGAGEVKVADVAPPEVRNPLVYKDLMNTRAELDSLREREKQVSKQIKDYEKRVELTPANEQKFDELSRDYNVSLKNYQTLLEKKMNAKLSENLEKREKGERFTIIDPANTPEKPYKPNRLAIAILSVFGGLGAGLGLVLLVEYMNPAFSRQEDLEEALRLPVLAIIPEFSSGKKTKSAKNLSLVKRKKAGAI